MSFKRVINCVETHSGEPMRVVTGGVAPLKGNSVYEQMVYLREHDDALRKFLLREPRGYPPLCCNILVPPKDPKAAAGYIIMEQVEYPLMSGGNTISVATVLLETGIIPMVEPVTVFILEAPAGLIGIKAECHNGKVTQVTFKNVPAFAAYVDKEIDVPHLGKVKVDVAWGGMWYVIADVRFCRRSFAVFAATSAQPTSSSTARGTRAARSSAGIRPGVNSPTFSVKPSSVPICAMRTWTWGTC